MASTKDRHLNLLLNLTGIPTAAGKEDRVIAYIERWVSRRKNLRLRRDTHGNLIVTQTPKARPAKSKPVVLTTHLDHPAFVIRGIFGEKAIELEFRGGVHDRCFAGKEVEIFDAEDRPHRGRIEALKPAIPFKLVTVELQRKTDRLAPGDIGRWRLKERGSEPFIAKGLLYAPACDDLAGAAAALSVLDILRRRKGFAHVGVLLTLAEEVGFVGAIGAAQNGTIPRDARLICLENSRSFSESPIGAGPILRVGDKTGIFSPHLTNLLTQILREHETENPNFRWQRKLMPGGTCEATAFAEFGHHATCVCLPLGNYHNMTDMSLPEGAKPTGGIGPEYISIEDYTGLLEMLRVCIEKMDETQFLLRETLEKRFAKMKHVLPEPCRGFMGVGQAGRKRA